MEISKLKIKDNIYDIKDPLAREKIKTLEEKQNSTDDEVNQVTGEVSDIKIDIGNINKDQTLQNKAIQKNVDDILAVDKKATSNTQRTENIERNIFDSGLAEGEAPLTVKDSALSEIQEVEMTVAVAQDGVPTPETPVVINKIDKDFVLKTTGKNLFDKSKISSNSELIGSDGSTTISDSYFVTDFIPVKPNALYIYSGKSGGTSNCFYDINKKFIETVNGQGIKEPIVVPNNSKIKFLRMNTGIVRINTLQIEENDKATPYEPYVETTTPITLKGNEILPFDKLAVKYDSGKYKLMLEKNMIEKIITENINIAYSESQSNNTYFFQILFGDMKGSNKDRSNYFKYSSGNYNTGVESFTSYSSGKLDFVINKNRLVTPNKEGVLNWLKVKRESDNPLKIVYELKEPKIIQLAEFDNFNLMFNSITNIITSINNINLKVKYYRDFITTIRNLQVDNGALQSQLQDIEARIKALEGGR